MKDLLAKLEAATEGSRELDAEIAAFGDYKSKTYYQWRGMQPRGSLPDDREFLLRYAPHYTTSLDAAMTLVPDGWTVCGLRQGDNKLWTCELREGFATSYNRVVIEPSGSGYRGTSAPLALCIASLRARGETA